MTTPAPRDFNHPVYRNYSHLHEVDFHPEQLADDLLDLWRHKGARLYWRHVGGTPDGEHLLVTPAAPVAITVEYNRKTGLYNRNRLSSGDKLRRKLWGV